MTRADLAVVVLALLAAGVTVYLIERRATASTQAGPAPTLPGTVRTGARDCGGFYRDANGVLNINICD